MARTDTFSRNKSRFESMDSAAMRDFHSPEAQRFRNQQRKETRERGEVYDDKLRWNQPNNEEGIATATNDTFGNDEFTLGGEGSTEGGGGGVPDGYEETDVILCQDGSPVSGQILFKPD